MRLLLAFAIVLVSGCTGISGVKGPKHSDSSHWQGRLALKVQSEPPHALAADFALNGNAQAGTLQLFTPLGNTAARLAWTPGSATLQTGGEPQTFASLGDMAQRATGADLPIGALFDWLDGMATPAAGWEVDLTARDSGRITARRLPPAVPAELKIILDTP